MARDPRVLFISTYPPQQCGIATFTQHLINALPHNGSPRGVRVAAIVSGDEHPEFDDLVVHRIDNRRPTAYREAAEFANTSPIDAVCLQHEFGLFSGESGRDVLSFLEACHKPVVTTLHTILPEPTDVQRDIVRGVGRQSRRVVAMANVGIDLLTDRYGLSRSKMVFIPHGVPRIVPADRETVRRGLGLDGRRVILTFGLLGRGKGIEYMIDALPEVCRHHPDALYLVVGRTHPNVLRSEGEAYRDELARRAADLGVTENLRFVNRFIADDELVPYLQACDVYVTPYLGRDQITSGTLSDAMAAGCAVVSTPYLYAEELLADGRGRLVDFRSSAALAAEVNAILGDPALQARLMSRAYSHGLSMSWRNVGKRYQALFATVAQARALAVRQPRAGLKAEPWAAPRVDGTADRPTVQGT